MSNVGRSQGRKEIMTGITVNDLGVMGGGCGDGQGRGGEGRSEEERERK